MGSRGHVEYSNSANLLSTKVVRVTRGYRRTDAPSDVVAGWIRSPGSRRTPHRDRQTVNRAENSPASMFDVLARSHILASQ